MGGCASAIRAAASCNPAPTTSKRLVSETAAQRGEQRNAIGIAVRDPVRLQREREPLDEGLERQQRSCEPGGTGLALACRGKPPSGARMCPERELALATEPTQQRAAA